MKLTRKKLRKLIEAMIKPSLEVPDISDHMQQNLYTMAAGRDDDRMGREYADNAFDALVDPLSDTEDKSYSDREFEYDYPLVKHPAFGSKIIEAFEIYAYINKGFAGDIEVTNTFEDFMNNVIDIHDIVSEAINSNNYKDNIVPNYIEHTFSDYKDSENISYKLKNIIHKIIEPEVAKLWIDWRKYFKLPLNLPGRIDPELVPTDVIM